MVKFTTDSAGISPVKYVAYYRISTKGKKDLSLEVDAQRVAVASLVDGPIIAEYTEVESRGTMPRSQLAAAIERARRTDAVLIVGKLDSARSEAAIIGMLQEAGISFQCADKPTSPSMTRLAQGEHLPNGGWPQATPHSECDDGQYRGHPADADLEGAAGQPSTDRLTISRALHIANSLYGTGATLARIAIYLNEAGFRTTRGCRFHATQVRKLLRRLH